MWITGLPISSAQQQRQRKVAQRQRQPVRQAQLSPRGGGPDRKRGREQGRCILGSDRRRPDGTDAFDHSFAPLLLHARPVTGEQIDTFALANAIMADAPHLAP
jgi:hypothetical protein